MRALGDLKLVIQNLDKDEGRAWNKYQALHKRLTKFFACRRMLHPHELADRTFDRVAKILDLGNPVRLRVQLEDCVVSCLGSNH